MREVTRRTITATERLLLLIRLFRCEGFIESVRNKTPVYICSLLLVLLSTPVAASIPSFLQSLGLVPEGNSVEEARPVIGSIPAMEELRGIRYSAMIVDLSSGSSIAESGEGVFTFNIPEIFILASDIEMIPLDSLVPGYLQETETESSCTAVDVARAMQIIHTGMDRREVIELLEKPDMGEGQAASVGEGWELYGWVDSGEDHKTFALIAISPEGKELGFVLLSDDLCCEEKGDLAMLLLWQAALQLN